MYFFYFFKVKSNFKVDIFDGEINLEQIKEKFLQDYLKKLYINKCLIWIQLTGFHHPLIFFIFDKNKQKFHKKNNFSHIAEGL